MWHWALCGHTVEILDFPPAPCLAIFLVPLFQWHTQLSTAQPSFCVWALRAAIVDVRWRDSGPAKTQHLCTTIHTGRWFIIYMIVIGMCLYVVSSNEFALYFSLQNLNISTVSLQAKSIESLIERKVYYFLFVRSRQVVRIRHLLDFWCRLCRRYLLTSSLKVNSGLGYKYFLHLGLASYSILVKMPFKQQMKFTFLLSCWNALPANIITSRKTQKKINLKFILFQKGHFDFWIW